MQDCYLTTLLLCRKLRVLFMGTNKGSIRVSLWPMVSYLFLFLINYQSKIKFEIILKM